MRRVARRIRMNASRAAIPAKEARIASIRKNALSECGRPLKIDPITHPKTDLRTSLRAGLMGDVKGNVLTACQPVFRAGAEAVRRKAANLVRLRVILGARGKKNICRELRTEWDVHPGHARGAPFAAHA